MTTPILGIPELADGQINQFAVANAAIRALESASNAVLSVNLSSGDHSLTAGEFTENFVFVTTGNSTTRTLTVQATRRVFAVLNGGSSTLNVTLGSTTLTLASNKTRLFYTDGTANGLTQLDLS